MSARIGVVQFPGTNCELDVMWAVEQLGARAELCWHGDATVNGVDAVVVPGGFAHGDYLRTGALARFSPVMTAVTDFAAAGGPVVGICNGFQVLTEAELLPGALQKNAGLKFLCETVELRVETTTTVLTERVRGRAALAHPDQPLRRQLRVRRRRRSTVCVTTIASSFATPTIPTAASTTSPASATTVATSWGSCRTPSGRPT